VRRGVGEKKSEQREQRHTPNKRRKSSEAAKKAWGEMGGRERWAKDEVDCISWVRVA